VRLDVAVIVTVSETPWFALQDVLLPTALMVNMKDPLESASIVWTTFGRVDPIGLPGMPEIVTVTVANGVKLVPSTQISGPVTPEFPIDATSIVGGVAEGAQTPNPLHWADGQQIRPQSDDPAAQAIGTVGVDDVNCAINPHVGLPSPVARSYPTTAGKPLAGSPNCSSSAKSDGGWLGGDMPPAAPGAGGFVPPTISLNDVAYSPALLAIAYSTGFMNPPGWPLGLVPKSPFPKFPASCWTKAMNAANRGVASLVPAWTVVLATPFEFVKKTWIGAADIETSGKLRQVLEALFPDVTNPLW
jgi:hypothetical protein